MKKALLAVVLSVAMIGTGCPATWFSAFQGYLAIAAPAAINVLELIALAKGQAVNPAAIAKLNGDSKALQTLAQSVANATSQNLSSSCAAFNIGVSTFVADLPTVEQVGNVTNPTTQAQIEDAVLLLQSTIAEVETPISACQGTTAVTAHTLRASVAASRVTSPSDFVKKYNAIMARDSATARLKIHIHSAAVRYASAGLLK